MDFFSEYLLWQTFPHMLLKMSEKYIGISVEGKKKQFFNSEKTKIETNFWKILKQETVVGANSDWCTKKDLNLHSRLEYGILYHLGS